MHQKDRPHFILWSIVVLCAIPLFFFLLVVLNNPISWSKQISFKYKTQRIYGRDASPIDLYLTEAAQPKQEPTVLFVPDSYLNYNWNPRGLRIDTAKLLVQELAAQGIESLRYEHRTIRKTELSSETRNSLPLILDDFKLVYQYAQKKYKNIVVFAHGTGCELSLKGIQKYLFKPSLILLSSCHLSGNLLEKWGAKVLFKLQKTAANNQEYELAKGLWMEWLSNHRKQQKSSSLSQNSSKSLKFKESKKQASPNILAFQQALHHLESSGMKYFREMGEQINLKDIILELSKKNIPILHFFVQYDEESSIQDTEKSLVFSSQIHNHIEANYPQNQLESSALASCTDYKAYVLFLLKNTNSFLKESQGVPSLIVTHIRRRFWTTRLSAALLQKLECLI